LISSDEAAEGGFRLPDSDDDILLDRDRIELRLNEIVTIRLTLRPGSAPVETIPPKGPAWHRAIAMHEVVRASVRWREPRCGAAS
jgi:hypothetical protein